jgi:hypothetical protein
MNTWAADFLSVGASFGAIAYYDLRFGTSDDLLCFQTSQSSALDDVDLCESVYFSILRKEAESASMKRDFETFSSAQRVAATRSVREPQKYLMLRRELSCSRKA